MTRPTSLAVLEADERRARARLDIYRAKLYNRPQPSVMVSLNRLHKLERDWEFAAKRLRSRQAALAAQATERPASGAQR